MEALTKAYINAKRNERTLLEARNIEKTPLTQFNLSIGLATCYNKTPRTMISKTYTFWKTIPATLYGTGYIIGPT